MSKSENNLTNQLRFRDGRLQYAVVTRSSDTGAKDLRWYDVPTVPSNAPNFEETPSTISISSREDIPQFT